MLPDQRRGDPPEQVIWIGPGSSPQSNPSSAGVARELGERVKITQIGLAVWDLAPGEPYDLAVEVSAVRATALAHGLSRYHLFGFSAGATVALGAALAFGEAVLSITVLEAAVIGDDDWGPSETAWRAGLAAVRDLPPDRRGHAFRDLMMRPGEPLPPLGPPPLWDARTDLLEDMLAQVGFVSSDLAAITQPVLAINGGRSNPRMHDQDERLVQVIPQATTQVFSECSHLSPPHRTEPSRLAGILLDFWVRSSGNQPRH